MKISAAWNWVVGAALTYFLGPAIGMLILGAFEVRFLIETAKEDGGYHLYSAKVIAVFEMITGLFTVVPLVCGLITMIKAVSLDAERSAVRPARRFTA